LFYVNGRFFDTLNRRYTALQYRVHDREMVEYGKEKDKLKRVISDFERGVNPL
jgi:hypothetical protein